MKNISFIIPFKSCNNERDVIFNWVCKRIKSLYCKSEIIICTDNSEVFSRGRALNNGVRKANNEILVLVDGDIFFHDYKIEESIELLNNKNWVIPFSEYIMIDKDATDRILKQKPCIDVEELKPFRAIVFTHTLGAINIIKRKDYIKIGGFDERLNGWGYDDNIFAYKANLLIGEFERLDGHIYHLYHPAKRDIESIETLENKLIWEEYSKLKTENEIISYMNKF